VTFDGHEILIGRGDVENDELTFTVAEPDDLWLHVAGGIAGKPRRRRNPEKQPALPHAVIERAAISPRGIRRRAAGRASRSTTAASPDVRKRRGAPAGRSSSKRWERIRVSATEPGRAMTPAMDDVHYRVCPLCEATCGLEIRTRGREVVGIRGDDADPFSRGFICPEGLRAEGARRRSRPAPHAARPTGRHPPPGSWDEAVRRDRGRLAPILRDGGRDAVGVVRRQPGRTQHGADPLRAGAWRARSAAGTSSRRAPSTRCRSTSPAGLVFGTKLSIPVPDIDRTDYLLVLGANPLVSNGSLMTAPDLPARLRAIRERGGKIVVLDPRRTRTASEASEHHFIRPGTDAHLLLGIVHVLFADGLVRLGRLAPHVAGLDQAESLARPFTPEAVSARCGVPAAVIRRLAHELATAERAAVYGRIGTCTQAFGTLASWLVDVVNVLTGHLDQPGGAMFTRPATGSEHTRGVPDAGRAFASDAGTAASASCPRCSASSPRPVSPRRSTPAGRPASARSSRSPGTRCSARRTAVASTARSPRSTSW
jgi:anaerobic selenocysteine-containing dehydrogenase